jgi:hypothetical protein
METSVKIPVKLTKLQKRRKIFVYLLASGIISIIFAFILYKVLESQAFGDRGTAKNVMPTLFTNESKEELIKSINERFKCSSHHEIDVSQFNSVGMFPYLLKNTVETCNKAADFVGYDKFIDAMLHGEKHLGIPATSSKSASYNHHHPGLEILKNLLERGEKFDRSVEFYWWMFPVPMGIPNRGFAYAIYQGDLEGLQSAAKSRGLVFENIYLEGIKVFLKFQGWDIETVEKFSNFTYDEKDHIVTKVWISLKCFSEYFDKEATDAKFYKESLEIFMNQKLIRYPTDFKCIYK